jgi:hypothetical protein
MLAKTVCTLTTTGHVGHTGIIGNKAVLMDKFINTRVASTVATACDTASTIEKILDRQVDFVPTGIGNFDSVCECRQRTVSPTRTAVLGNMLIQTVGKVTQTIDISPIEILRKVFWVDVLVREWRVVVVSHLMPFEDLP